MSIACIYKYVLEKVSFFRIPFPDGYLCMYVTLIPRKGGVRRESLLECEFCSLGVLLLTA